MKSVKVDVVRDSFVRLYILSFFAIFKQSIPSQTNYLHPSTRISALLNRLVSGISTHILVKYTKISIR